MIGTSVRRGLLALAIALGLVAGVTAAAQAADPVTVGISDIKAVSTTVTGVLTLRSRSAVQVDPATLTARIDGQDAVQQHAAGRLA